ncbi:rCG40767 [Rattus norvegicus]|uniref:RCG40767 n=1 Tax=Rattus norvegicus TaxID=10116 RepID=A6KP16_RAT|nr:rCG40767 [Rattus norvegicus]
MHLVVFLPSLFYGPFHPILSLSLSRDSSDYVSLVTYHRSAEIVCILI